MPAEGPWMWIIAGSNGAGKSTFRDEFFEELGLGGILKLNADEVTAKLRLADPLAPQDELNLRAARVVDAEVVDRIGKRQDFVVETVLSSDKYRDDFDAAKAAGFQFGLVYVSLHPPELSPLRVQERVLKQGHAVEPGRAISRYHRSHEQLVWFAPSADALMVFDNSSENGTPVLIYSREEGAWLIKSAEINPAVDRAMAAAFPN